MSTLSDALGFVRMMNGLCAHVDSPGVPRYIVVLTSYLNSVGGRFQGGFVLGDEFR